MRDFYATSQRMPLDQADGLRRLFAGKRSQVLALAANPHVAFSGIVLDRVASVLAGSGRQVLVVDGASSSPPASEMAGVDLAACIERIAPRVSYLAARGLPLAYVDTRGSAAGFIHAVQQAAPQAEVVLLHADAADLARLLKHRELRVLLLGADHPESIKHAYASAKLLSRRLELMAYDLLLAAPPHSPRLAAITQSLADCLDSFLGAALLASALVDPAGDLQAPPDRALSQLLAAQLMLDESAAQGLPLAPQRTAAAAQDQPRPVFR